MLLTHPGPLGKCRNARNRARSGVRQCYHCSLACYRTAFFNAATLSVFSQVMLFKSSIFPKCP